MRPRGEAQGMKPRGRGRGLIVVLLLTGRCRVSCVVLPDAVRL